MCVFVVLLVSRRWQKNPPERSKGTYELKKMILSWISAEGIHPLPAASSDDLESVQVFYLRAFFLKQNMDIASQAHVE